MKSKTKRALPEEQIRKITSRLARERKAAIQRAATYAMLAERKRIRLAIEARNMVVPPVAARVLYDVLGDIDGPMSGAPIRGAVKGRP